MEEPIPATCLNDFVFCPASIYFHRFYDGMDNMAFQRKDQINGTVAHHAIDNNRYSTSRDVITSLESYSEKFNLICKIDSFNARTGTLVERKKRVKQIYDGYIFQMYAQYFCMIENGYNVEKLQIYSMDDNKTYKIRLPNDDPEMFAKFKNVIEQIMYFDLESFVQTNAEKCRHCIYEPACDRTLDGLGGDESD